MGRGRAKAKQTKVARELKYHSPNTDLAALQRELGGNGRPVVSDPDVGGEYDEYLDDDADEDDDDEDEDEASGGEATGGEASGGDWAARGR